MRKKKIFVGLIIFLLTSINVVSQNDFAQEILYSKTKKADINLSYHPKNFPGAILITGNNEIIPLVGHAGMIINSQQIIESTKKIYKYNADNFLLEREFNLETKKNLGANFFISGFFIRK